MTDLGKTIRFYSGNIHLDDGELAAGEVVCSPGRPLELSLGSKSSDAIALPESAHVALGRFDPHVHFRESALPTPDEHRAHGPAEVPYDTLVANIEAANRGYSIRSGCLSALRGGVAGVGAMGNTPWSPVGHYRHDRSQSHYTEMGLIPIVLWPRMEPGVEAISGHEGKDFGSTFGGSGLAGQARQNMYDRWKGEAVSFHNDQARSTETLSEFKARENPEKALLHHLYFNGETVLACQKETLAIAKAAGVSSLLARHIPTGPALQQLVDARSDCAFELPLEVGLDYVYWCRERLLEQEKATALINYRRPAHPSREDQRSLIELTKERVRAGDAVFFGSDHAPHAKASKAFDNGLPGSPGTRNIEHSLQFYMELKIGYGYEWQDIDRLAAINPAKRMAKFFEFPYEVGTMASGAMANLAIFDPDAAYTVDESALSKNLEDPEYHSALTGEKGLRGQSLFTVANGVVWDVSGRIARVN